MSLCRRPLLVAARHPGPAAKYKKILMAGSLKSM
jgi:hypothetical protein